MSVVNSNNYLKKVVNGEEQHFSPRVNYNTIMMPDGNLWDGSTGGGDVQTVCGVEPDENGNVQLEHTDVGALSSDPRESEEVDPELAAVPINADTLGGVSASKYALKTDTAPDSEKLGGVEPSGYVTHNELGVMVKTIRLESTGSITAGNSSQRQYALDIPAGYTAHVLAVHIANTTNVAYGKVFMTFGYGNGVINLSLFNESGSTVNPSPLCTYMLVKEVA